MTQKETFHYESQDDAVMSLMNQHGWTRERAERYVSSLAEQAHLESMALQEELCQRPVTN